MVEICKNLPLYSLVSIGVAIGIVANAVKSGQTFFDIVIQITSSKLNLVIFLNCLAVLINGFARLVILIFFGQVRMVEAKDLTDNSIQKIFQFIILTIMWRNSIDIYQVSILMLVLATWCLHWLAVKRANGLIGEESRNLWSHIRIMTLFGTMIALDGFIVYIFVLNYFKYGKALGDLYLVVGFEVSLKHRFRILLIGLHYR